MKNVKREVCILSVFIISATLISCTQLTSAPSDEQIKQDLKNYYVEYWKLVNVEIKGKSTEGNNCTVLTDVTVQRPTGEDRVIRHEGLIYQKFDTGWKCMQYPLSR